MNGIIKLTDFWNNKTIKLSDAFDVFIDFEGTGINYERMVTCCGFTLPKFEFEEETIKYGNMSQIFLTPKYDSCKELTLEFFETADEEIVTTTDDVTMETEKLYPFNPSITLSKFLKYMSLIDIDQKYINDTIVLDNDEEATIKYLLFNQANYDKNKIIPEIKIKILNNKLKKYVYEYRFINLKLTNYTIYNLDYQSDSPCKVTFTLGFEAYEKRNINEFIKYNENEVIPEENTTNDYSENDATTSNTDSIDPPIVVPNSEAQNVFMNELADEYYTKLDEWENEEGDYLNLKGNDAAKQAAKNSMTDLYSLLANVANGEATDEDIENYKNSLDEYEGLTKNGKKRALETLENELETIRFTKENSTEEHLDYIDNAFVNQEELADIWDADLELESMIYEEERNGVRTEESNIKYNSEEEKRSAEAATEAGQIAASEASDIEGKRNAAEQAYLASQKMQQKADEEMKSIEVSDLKSGKITPKENNAVGIYLQQQKAEEERKQLEKQSAEFLEKNRNQNLEQNEEQTEKQSTGKTLEELKKQMKPEDWAKAAAKEDIKYGTKKGDRGNSFAIGLTQIDQTEEAYDAYTDAYDAYIDKNGAEPEKKKVPVKTKKVTIGELSKELDASKLSFGNRLIVNAAIAMNSNTEIEVPVDRKTTEKTYFGFTAKEIGVEVAKYDKDNNTKESTAYSIAYQYMDEGDKNTFKTSYQNELNK